MNRVADLNKALADSAERLVDCATQLNELGLLKAEKAIYKIGKAIAEVNEVRSALYRIHPELKPELWDTPPSNAHFASWFEEAKKVAAEYLAEGNPRMAKSTFESFLSIGPSEQTASLAKQELAKLRKEHGD